MEAPDDKENQPPESAIGSLQEELPLPTVRYTDRYTRGHPMQILHFGENARSLFMLDKPTEKRLRLVIALKEAPLSVDAWLELLRCPLVGNPAKYNKIRLLKRALTCVDSEEARQTAGYTEMRIMLAKLSDTEAGVRQNFREMKKRRVGEKQPLLYEEEAAFEYAAGNKDAAEEVLERGVDNDALTPTQKEQLLKKVVAGRAGWVAAFSGSPQEQKVLALRTLRRTQNSFVEDKHRTQSALTTTRVATPLHPSIIPADTTPFSRGRDGPVTGSVRTATTPSIATPAPHNSNKSPLLTTPSIPTRSSLKTLSTSRKTYHPPLRFQLGGPALRVIANQSDDDDDDDDAMMGSEATPTVPSKAITPIKKTANPASSFLDTMAESKEKSKINVSDIKHILKWDPDKTKEKMMMMKKGMQNTPTGDKDAKDSIGPSAKPRALSVTFKTSLPPEKASMAVPELPSKGSAGVEVNGQKYIKLEQIGSGGSSKVYRMLGPDLKIYALKKIKLKKLDAQSIAQFTNEIELLKKLQGNPYIIKLIAAEQDLQQRQINVIMEHGEIDLSERLRDLKGEMDENMLRVIWTQMLQAVNAIHQKRIIHGDLKPANFLFVNGALKLIDFGIAKTISNDTTNIERDSQIGTVNFMSPEAIQGNTAPNGQRDPQGKMKVGRASDIWSLGCILYQIVYSKPPFGDVHNIIEKFRCIIDPAVPINFPSLQNKDLEDVVTVVVVAEDKEGVKDLVTMITATRMVVEDGVAGETKVVDEAAFVELKEGDREVDELSVVAFRSFHPTLTQYGGGDEALDGNDETLEGVELVERVVTRLLKFTWDLKRDDVKDALDEMIAEADSSLNVRLKTHRTPALLPKLQLPRSKGGRVYESSDEYFRTVVELWIGMTFVEGNNALLPHCTVKMGDKMQHTKGYCSRCAGEYQQRLRGPPSKYASTHIYDGSVANVKYDGTLSIEQVASRRPPLQPIHWRTTKRLSSPNLIGIVRLANREASLRATDEIYWAEIIFQGKSFDEYKARERGRLTLRLLQYLDEPGNSLKTHNPAIGDAVAIIDCQTFVPEFIPVLKALEKQRQMPVPFQNGALLNLCNHVSFGPNADSDRTDNDDYEDDSDGDANPITDTADIPSHDLIRKVVQLSLLDPIVDIRRDEALRNQLEYSLLRLAKSATLDPGQLRSFAEALMYPVHCTQGPPGTGKSYLGVVVVRALLVIRDLWKRKNGEIGDPPILVLSYKNHAIDEFLLDLLRSEPTLDHTPRHNTSFGRYYLNNGFKKLVRIGGGCSEPELEPYRERNVAFSDPSVRKVSERIEACQDLRDQWHKFRDCFTPIYEAQTVVAGDTKTLDPEERKTVQGAVPAVSSAVATLLKLAETISVDDNDKALNVDDTEEKANESEDGESDQLVSVAPTVTPIEIVKRMLVAKPMLTNANIAVLHEGIKHYDPAIDPMEVLYQWISGFCPLPACAYPKSRLNVSFDESKFCQEHSCKFTQDGEYFCLDAVVHKRLFCERHLCSAEKCKNCRMNDVQLFCEDHACFVCLAREERADVAVEEPPRNTCDRHPLCWGLEGMCVEVAEPSSSHCKMHAEDLYCKWVSKRGEPCAEIATTGQYCGSHHAEELALSERMAQVSTDKCQARTRKGKLCKAVPLSGSNFCRDHVGRSNLPVLTFPELSLPKADVQDKTKEETEIPKMPSSDAPLDVEPPQSSELDILKVEDAETDDATVKYDDVWSLDSDEDEDNFMDAVQYDNGDEVEESEHLQHMRDVFEVEDDDVEVEIEAVEEFEEEEKAPWTSSDQQLIRPHAWHWDTALEERWNALFSVLNLWGDLNTRLQHAFAKQLEDLKVELQREILRANSRVYEGKSVIGGTITGCVSRLEAIRTTNPFAILVEEASEVMEPLLLSCFSSSTRKLEMIGDHMQLQPSVMGRIDFERVNKINISMFERLISAPQGNEVPSSVLSIQRRMRKSICDLTRSFYDDITTIEDHEVCGTKVIGGAKRKPGMVPLLDAQERASVGLSRVNQQEAKMTCKLVQYLVHCGVPAKSIAVLTPYKGQLMLMRKMLMDKYGLKMMTKERDPRPVPSCFLSTVDRFQGDEADIVIISLVIDGKSRTPFVKLQNHMIVLLSRARLGMYVVGNAEYFGETSHWKKTFELLEKDAESDNTEAIPVFVVLSRKLQGRDIDKFEMKDFGSQQTLNGIEVYEATQENFERVVSSGKASVLFGHLYSAKSLKNPTDIPKNKGNNGNNIRTWLSRQQSHGYDAQYRDAKYGKKGGAWIVWHPYALFPIHRVKITDANRETIVSCLPEKTQVIQQPLKISFNKPTGVTAEEEEKPANTQAPTVISDEDIDKLRVLSASVSPFFEKLNVWYPWDGKSLSTGAAEAIPQRMKKTLISKLSFVPLNAANTTQQNPKTPFGGIKYVQNLQAQGKLKEDGNLFLALELLAVRKQDISETRSKLEKYVTRVCGEECGYAHPLVIVALARLAVRLSQTPSSDIQRKLLHIFTALYPEASSLWLNEAELQLLQTTINQATASGSIVSGSVSVEDKWESLKSQYGCRSQAMEDLLKLVGLKKVKHAAVNMFRNAMMLQQLSLIQRKKNSMAFNYCFVGNPGTGKTTVARLFAKILNDSMIRRTNTFVECTAQQLKDDGAAEFRLKLRKASGGVLFIDEAYELDPAGDFKGKPIVAELLTAAEDKRDDLSIILAGYEDDIQKKLYAYNDGLPSRFEEVVFEDFDSQDLEIVWDGLAQDRGWEYEKAIANVACRRLAKAAGRKGFGNARAVRKLFEQVVKEAIAREDFDGTLKFQTVDLLGDRPSTNPKLQAVLDEVEEKTGWHKIKEEMKKLVRISDENYERELKGQETVPVCLNRLFLGNPGTGKTTCAGYYGRVLKALYFLSNGEVVKKTAGDFICNHVGESQTKTAQILDMSKGKVLVIDEAYNLNDNMYGKQVLDVLVEKVQGTESDDLTVLLIGYEHEMLEMLRTHNPGLIRRFPPQYAFHFEDYTEHELLDILEWNCSKRNVTCPYEVAEALLKQLALQKTQPNFGNAGAVEQLLKHAMGKAMSRPMVNGMTVLALEDVGVDVSGEKSKEQKDPVKLLDKLYRMDEIKEQLIQLRNQMIVADREGSGLPEVGHFVFRGSPGTGKTTVARVMAEILHGMGVLATPKLVETSGLDLTGEHVGQTKQKVTDKLGEAKGGLLFIDEAYELGKGVYGEEAMTTLVAAMTDPSYVGMVIIIAGYPKDMDQMLDRNVGLKSRFTRFIDFPDWEAQDAVVFLSEKAESENFDVESEAVLSLQKTFVELKKLSNVGNGRDAVRVWKELLQYRSQRVVNEPEEERTITESDADKAGEAILVARRGGGVPGKGVATDEDPMKILDELYRMDQIRNQLSRLKMEMTVAEREGSTRPEIGHFVFRGSPGTGKTTVARVMAQILHAMRALGTTKLVETSGLDLTGEYVGQTKAKVTEKLVEAKGGLLFIDEAYELGKGMYGEEAMTTLVAAMTDPSYAGMVIVIAGYPKDMDVMLNRNAGLKSRFTRFIDFPDWEAEDGVAFLQAKAEKEEIEWGHGAEGILYQTFVELKKLDGFGNGRDAVRVWKELLQCRAQRVFDSPEEIRTITGKDAAMAGEIVLAARRPPDGPVLSQSSLPSDNSMVRTQDQQPPQTQQPLSELIEWLEPEQVTLEEQVEEKEALSVAAEEIVEVDAEEDPYTDEIEKDGKVERDPDVSDEDWEELERAKEAHAAHLEALKRARDQATREEERRRAQAKLEEKRRRAAAIQEKIRQICPCPAGFKWYKHGSGWRCGGGSHFVSDAQLNSQFTR
ncbi:hypothetical protein JG688_00006251 [Phytophthora aleatoria]|uniref:Protein kinase domain-containing protein n=1 Tax=Phytophthora aleatoria TaxID=2496075 RepID=A0A8J5IQW8_9STRA|nr:hypothetical protein JG688_00006251 [Phytophthora aleatoria]